MSMHGQYSTPAPHVPHLGRNVVLALLGVLLVVLGVGVALLLAQAMAPRATEEVAPTVNTAAYQEYRADERNIAPLPADAVVTDPAYEEYRVGERNAAPLPTASIVGDEEDALDHRWGGER